MDSDITSVLLTVLQGANGSKVQMWYYSTDFNPSDKVHYIGDVEALTVANLIGNSLKEFTANANLNVSEIAGILNKAANRDELYLEFMPNNNKELGNGVGIQIYPI